MPRDDVRSAQGGLLRSAWDHAIRPVLSVVFFALAGWFLWRQFEHLSWRDFLDALAQTSPYAVLVSIALTAGSYACLAATETVSLRALGHRLSYLQAARVAIPAYALTNTAGFSPATGTLFRVQMYRNAGLDARASALVALVAGSSVALSGVVATGLVILAEPGSIGDAVHAPAWRAFVLGLLLASPALLWLFAFTPRAPKWLGGETSPGGRLIRGFGLLAGLGDWLFSTAALFVLLPEPSLSLFPAFLCAYTVGALVSAATGVPGGLGVFEAIVLGLTAMMSQVHETAAALLLYRCIYSFGPLAIWAGASLVHAARNKRSGAADDATDAKQQTAYWAEPSDALFARMDSSPNGLSQAEAERRLQLFGPNIVREQQVTPTMRLLLRQFQSPLVLILIFAGLIAGVLQDWLEASIILAMVAGSTLLGFFQEHRASHAIANLQRRLTLNTFVRRGGRVELPFSAVVPGDVVLLSAGAIVPADGVVLSATNLLISEAALTGESFPVEKRPGVVAQTAAATARVNCIFAGSSVRSGTGEALITATGRNTEFGLIAQQLLRRPLENDFARGIRRFGYMLIRVMFGIVLFVLIINQLLGRPFVESLLFSVALGLGMSPELLPAIVSVTLAAGATQLARKGVIVRQLEAIENLGGMTVFCTDKTGTLTEGEIHMIDAIDCAGRTEHRVRNLGFLNAALQAGVRNPLDEAILSDGRSAGLSIEGVTKLGETPYDFTRKRVTVVADDAGQGGLALMVLKGAVDNVLPLCTTMASGVGERLLDQEESARIQTFTADKAAQGLRLLAVATRRRNRQAEYTVADERDMRLEGFLVFLDPPKAEAITAIRDLRELNVAIKVLSGDNRHVVRHVAKEVGLTRARLLTGSELADLDASALSAAAERTTLFAEVDPQQKERIIRALQRRGHAVGYLGDGINDAPALHAADVGVSVDQAVDVARESADVVLLRRDLSVLRDGVQGGRRTFANTLKYINITTSANFGNMISMALAAPLLPFLPMSAKQILLNNLLTDLPAMAIASDQVDSQALDASQRLDTNGLRRFMLTFGLISSVFDLTAFAVLIKAIHAPETMFRTAWFMLSVLTELAALLSLRTRAPVWEGRPSRLLICACALVALVAVALPYSSSVAAAFDLAPLTGSTLLAIATLVVGYFAANEIAKRIAFRTAAPAHLALAVTPPPSSR